MSDVAGDYLAFRALLLESYRRALGQALPPRPQVARHWESAAELTFLALLPDQAAFHLAFSFGQLKGCPPSATPQTAGLFRLTASIFPGVDAEQLTQTLTALVPEAVDGATRAFLLRVAAQLAAAEVAAALDRDRTTIPQATSRDFVVTVPRRADLLHEPAAPPRMPTHAEGRVRDALAVLSAPLSTRLVQAFEAPEPSLLDLVRRAAWTD